MTQVPPERPGDTAAAAAGRRDWVDVARGIGIILMVQGHVMRSLVAAGMIAPTRAVMLADALVYAFHMPLFFVMSGLFARGARARSWRGVLRGRLLTVVYPYLLWSLVQGALAMLATRDVNHPVGAADLAGILVVPIGQFWFLYALFLCSLCVLLPPRLIWFGLLPLSILLSVRFGEGPMLLRACYFFPYYALGLALTAQGLSDLLGTWRRILLVAAAAWLAFALLFPLLFDWSRLAWQPPSIPARMIGVGGALGTLAVARLIAGRASLLARLGRASMPIFLLHVIVAGTLRTVSAHLGNPTGIPALAILLTLVGLFVPWGAQIVAARLGIEQWLGFGRSAAGPARLAAADAAQPLELFRANADVRGHNDKGISVP